MDCERACRRCREYREKLASGVELGGYEKLVYEANCEICDQCKVA